MREPSWVVGIDVGRFSQEWAVLDGQGKVRWRKRVPNMMLWLRAAWKQAVAKTGDAPAVFALEMDYGNAGALVRLLVEGGQEVRLCAPLRLKRYRESLGLGSKNDAKDAALIARFCQERREELPRAHRGTPGRQALRVLSRQLDRLGREVTRQVNYLKGVLVEYYPDLLTGKLLGDLTSPTALAFLKRYGALSKAQRTSIARLTELLRRASRGKVSRERALQIKESLKDYDLPPEVEAAYAEVVRSVVTTLETLLAEEDRLLACAHVAAEEEDSYGKLLEVPGFGSRLAVKVLGETGDPQAYRDQDHWAAPAGFVPVERQSGEGRGLRFLPEACNKRLRHAIYQSCVASLKASPACRAYYDRKVSEPQPRGQAAGKGKKYKPAVRAFIAMGRHPSASLIRCRLLWKLLTTEERYDESRLGGESLAKAV